MNYPIVGLLTDFGNDFAVASMKGVLLTQVPSATIIDIDHSIEKFSILSGGFVIEQVYSFFPLGAYFVCIIDPGVGSRRREIYLKKGSYHFVGPDNGLFSRLFGADCHAYIIDGKAFVPRSHTFHGRDIFVPAVAALIKNNRDFLTPIDWRELEVDKELSGVYVAYIDSFGNIKTTYVWNKEHHLPKFVLLNLNNREYKIPFTTTFSFTEPQALLAYCGSNNTLEIAVNQGSAQKVLNAKVGMKIDLKIIN